MNRQVSGRTVAIVVLVTLGAIQFIYWRTLVYQPPTPVAPGGGGGGGAPGGPVIVAEGRSDLLVTTVAGTGIPGYRDGPAGRAQFDGPSGVAVDRRGAVLVADTRNHRIRRIELPNRVTTVAGSGPTGDLVGGFVDGPATGSRFWCPAGVAVGPDDTIYVADTGNHCIRRVSSGRVSTLAGGGNPGFTDGAGPAARFRGPAGIAADRAGNLYVADTGNAAIRKVEPSGRVTTLARGAPLQAPAGVAVAPDGSLLVSDPAARRAFRLPGSGTTPPADAGPHPPAVGTRPPRGWGLVPAAFRIFEEVAPLEPGGAGVAPDGTRLVSDLARHVLFAEDDESAYLLAGVVQSAGARSGFSDAPGDAASFTRPFGIAADRNGALYIADFANHAIRRIAPRNEDR